MKTSVADRNDALLGRGARLDGGYVRFYSGPVPADADTPLSGNTLIVQCQLSNPACQAPSGGSMAFNAIGGAVTAATGAPSFARFVRFNGDTVADMLVPTELALSKTDWVSGELFASPAVTWSLPAG